ncbi:MAG: KpsF/GutQ family sugar-phosphate isomerase [Alphaproteobacteria bacterium]|nr:KpsF/GutQ family sugar-phosphate isomerase [Alphaproteobacteria bacterium]MDA7982824.1 KpsF/GutQ family sugar-phosphate isomerase [Alphaproteobacteria bacterium]MDA7988428.1 KpsF/GutQ family sugar-phosphate isomerase [Alphaproteobacteria bacterium]MDA8008782.1 KpsF/GutQ family sugar-phosphate isomerase [Alphaproteobacteria bacterium]
MSDRDLIADATRVLDTEIAAIAGMRDGLAGGFGENFVAAVGLIGGIAPGRVITTGMGKSGHIAVKIAATFSSTGTPAFFVHPAEAGHGDLGMITASDAVLALSNSGETAELTPILRYIKRNSIPLVAVTAKADSALAGQADVALVLPDFTEACPHGLAPTTSTTLQIALGDALAVALLKWRGFSSENFHDLHPRGSLGQQLLRVEEVMHGADEQPLASLDTKMSDAILIMTRSGFGCVGITAADGKLVGIITDGDLRRHMSADLLGKTASEVMSRDPQTVAPGATTGEALNTMESRKISAVFVIDESRRPVGFVRILDLLRLRVA